MISTDTLQQFILRHRNDARMLGSGASRVAFYCKKYDKVFKYEIGEWIPKPSQSEMEFRVAQSLPEKYKKFLPVEQMSVIIYEHREVYATVMPLLKVLDTDYDLKKRFREVWPHDLIRFIGDFYHLPEDMIQDFKQFIQEFRIKDLGLRNLGLNGRTLVLVDAGLTGESS